MSVVDLACETAPLPQATPTRTGFPDIWRRQVRPLLFGWPSPTLRGGAKRKPTLRVIVSQEHATTEEMAATVASLSPDLLASDEVVIVGTHGSSGRMPEWLPGSASLKYVAQQEGESFVAARNRAAAECSRDILLFADANVQAPERWVGPLLKVFEDNPVAAAVGPALTDMYQSHVQTFGMRFCDGELSTMALPKQHDAPYPVPLLPGTFLAARREVFDQMCGLDGGMRQSGAEDLELCLHLWTSGFQCFVVPQVSIAWMNPFAAGAMQPKHYWQDLLHNLLRLATVHFSPERLGEFIANASVHREYASAAATLLSGEISRRRRLVASGRRFSDNWFFRSING
jgi:GT2 family glycosyltransferase